MTSSSSVLSVEKSECPLIIRFGYMCINKEKIPPWIAILAFIYSYFQTLGTFIKSARLYLINDYDSFSNIYEIVSKICILTDFLDFESYNFFAVLIWFIILFHTFKHIGLTLYVIIKLAKKQTIPEIVKMDWGITCYFLPYIYFLPIHTMCITIFQLHDKGTLGISDVSGLNTAFFALTILIFVTNLVATISINLLFYTVVKTSDPLSHKDNISRMSELGNKIVVPIMWVFAKDYLWMQIVFFVLFVFKSFTQSIISIYYLPFYRVRILKLQLALISIINPLTIAMLVSKLLESTNLKTGLVFCTALWILFIPIFFKLHFLFLNQAFELIYIRSASELNHHHIMHKDTIYHYYRRVRKEPNEKKRTFDEKYFTFNLLNKMKEIDLSDNKQLRSLVRKDLEAGLKKYPNSMKLKLMLANHCVKYEESYLHAYSLISDVSKNTASFSVQITISLLYVELHNRLVRKYSSADSQGDTKNNLNMLKFIELQSLDKEMRDKIITQLTYQTRFWKNFVSSDPEMSFLIDMSEHVADLRSKITKFWRKFQKVNDENFRTPLLVFGVYSFIANNGQDAYAHITKYYNNAQKYKKIHQKNELSNETVFSADNVQIKINGSRSKLGKIMEVSQNFESILGYERNLTLGRNVSLIMPPYFKDKHDSFLLKHYETGTSNITSKTTILPAFTARNFIFPMWVHIKMSPLVHQEVSYIGVMRPVKDHKRTLLIKEDGTIDAMSENFSRDMNLSPGYGDSCLKIYRMCPDFKYVNDCFNKVAYKKIEESGALEEKSTTSLLTLGNLGTKTNKKQAKSQLATPNDSRYTERPLMNTTELDSSRLNFGDTSRLNDTRHDTPLESARSYDKKFEHTLRSTRYREPDALFSPTLKIKDPYMQEEVTDEEAQRVFDEYSNSEVEFTFYPRVDGPAHLDGDRANPITYKAKILLFIHGIHFIKALSLEKIWANKEEQVISSARSSNAELGSYQHDSSGKHEISRNLSPRAKENSKNLFANFIMRDIKKKKAPDSPKIILTTENKTPSPNLLSPRFAAKAPEIRINTQSSANLSDHGDRDHVDTRIFELIRDIHPNNIRRHSPKASENTLDKSGIGDWPSMELPARPSVEIPSTGRLQFVKHVDLESSMGMPDHENSFREQKARDTFKNKLKGKNKLIGQQILLNGIALILKEEKLVKSEDIDNFIDNQLKEFKGKLDKKMVEIGVAGEGSVSSSVSSKGRRLQIKISEVLSLQTPVSHMKLFLLFFFIFNMIGLFYLIAETVGSIVAVSNIESRSKVIQEGLLRVDTLVKLVRQTRVLQSILTNKFKLSNNYTNDIQNIIFSTEYQLSRLDNYSRDLLDAIGYIDDQYITSFFINNVRMYERDPNKNLVLAETTDPFQAVSNLIFRGKRFGRRVFPSSYYPGIDDQDMTYVADNSLNDLLISCESSVQTLYDALNSGSDNSKLLLLAFLISSIVLNASFGIVALISYFKTLKESTNFMNILFRVGIPEAQNTENLLSGYLNCLKSNSQEFELIKWFNEHEDSDLSNSQGQSKRINNRKASLKKLHIRYSIAFAALLPSFIYMLAWKIFFFWQSTALINQMLSQQNDINIALQTTYTQSMLDTTIVQIVYTNSTATVRNRPVEEVFYEILENTPNFDKVVNNFRDPEGRLSTIHQEIFFNYSCNNIKVSSIELYDVSTLKMECFEVAGGTGYVGLAKISSSLFNIMKNLMNYLKSTSRTQTDLDNTFLMGAATIPYSVDVYRALFSYLYEATLDDFNSTLSSTKDNIFLLCGIFGGLTVLVGLLTFFITITRIMKIEMEKKHTLALIPFKILLNNKFLKTLLVDISAGKLDNLKHIL